MKQKIIRKITVLYNTIDPILEKNPNMLAEAGAVEEANLLAKTLTDCGFMADTFEINKDSINLLANYPTDIFFNDTDGIGDDIKSEAKVPELLDDLGLAYTGSDARGLILTTDKVKTKEIFVELGFLTPKSKTFGEIPSEDIDLQYPLIVKPVLEDSSVGIGLDSVVNNFADLKKATEKILFELKEKVLVEEYIEGRELNIALLGNNIQIQPLPISEIIFGDYYLDKPKVVDFEAKWLVESPKYKETVGICPADLPDDLANELAQKSIAVFQACGARDYTRVDVRLDSNNIPYFLEVNLNPDIRPDTGIFRSAQAAGYDYPGFLLELIRIAGLRYGMVPFF